MEETGNQAYAGVEMIDYRRLGAVSEKPHTVFEHEGKMVAEHVFTRDGFSDLYSILYQKRAPTHEVKVNPFSLNNPGFPHKPATSEVELRRRHLKTPCILRVGVFLSHAKHCSSTTTAPWAFLVLRKIAMNFS